MKWEASGWVVVLVAAPEYRSSCLVRCKYSLDFCNSCSLLIWPLAPAHSAIASRESEWFSSDDRSKPWVSSSTYIVIWFRISKQRKVWVAWQSCIWYLPWEHDGTLELLQCIGPQSPTGQLPAQWRRLVLTRTRHSCQVPDLRAWKEVLVSPTILSLQKVA